MQVWDRALIGKIEKVFEARNGRNAGYRKPCSCNWRGEVQLLADSRGHNFGKGSRSV